MTRPSAWFTPARPRLGRLVAVTLGVSIVAGCANAGPSGQGPPDLNVLASRAARHSTCSASLPLTRQLGQNIGHRSAPAASALAGISHRLKVLSDGTQDSLLQQRLQDLVDEIAVLQSSWRHDEASRTRDVTARLRGMVNGFGITCPPN